MSDSTPANPAGTPSRGDRTAYARYLAGMDASMRQKVALTAAHLLCEGRVADMGMGSGAGSQALAALYPELSVVGVDLDPTMVALAADTHRLPNLSFVQGDIATHVFPDASLDGILDSSVLHHVTSFNGYDHEAAARALAAQVAQLRTGGVLVVRDFLRPEGRAVTIDLPHDDGDESDDPRTCSSARLFERCARELRSLSSAPGFPYERLYDPRPGWRRYRCALVHAIEHALRKDYRADWDAEIKEEYTYFTQARFEQVLASLGLRVLASTPLTNPWIVRHRFRGKLVLRDAESGEELDDPPTNYVIVGEKVAPDRGVRFVDVGPSPALGFLEASVWRDTSSGALRDLVRRPHRTIDVVPYFEQHGDVFVLARTSYPRPLVGAEGLPDVAPALDGARSAGWLAEPLVVVESDAPLGQTVEEALAASARIDADELLSLQRGTTYYPSPGGTQEEVVSMLALVAPVLVEHELPRTTPFSSSGRLRAIEARQLLRAAQVGGLPDARLELNTYDLLARLGRERGPWIGESIELRDSNALVAPTTLDALERRPRRRRFRRTTAPADRAPFLGIVARTIEERAASGEVLARTALEMVLPRARSSATVAVLPLLRIAGTVLAGIDDIDLPAAQCFSGHSEILVAPAWRLPHAVRSVRAMRALACERLRAEHGVTSGEVFELGGRFHPSAGLSPEVVHPLAIEVSDLEAPARALSWVALDELAARADTLVDGHLRVLVLRAAHALAAVGT